jgi:hypothetical protein
MGELNSKLKRVALLAGIGGILLTFQNCGRSGFDTVDESALMSSSLIGTNPNGKASAPVAFDVALDAIAYNSCVPNMKSHPAYFTLRTSAGGTRGGVRMTSEFMQAAQSQLRPILGNSEVLDVQYKELIDVTNEGMEVQVALRSATDFRTVFNGASQTGIWGAMSYLSHDSWLTPLIQSARRGGNAFIPYSARAPSNQSRMDYSFNQEFPSQNHWDSLIGASGFRSCVTQGCQGFGQFHIAVGFSEPGNRSVIRSPTAYSSTQSKAVGRGYQLQFGYPFNNPALGLRVVKGVAEYNMANGQPVLEGNQPTGWSCVEIPIMSPNQRGLAIRNQQPVPRQTAALDPRYDDRAPGQPLGTNPQTGLPIPSDEAPAYYRNLCNPMTGSFGATLATQFNLAKIREILPPSQWQLGYQNVSGQSRLCAIPVGGLECYPTSEQYPNYNQQGQANPYPYYVDYYPPLSQEDICINEDNAQTLLSQQGQQGVDSVCAHYITICTKQ